MICTMDYLSFISDGEERTLYHCDFKETNGCDDGLTLVVVTKDGKKHIIPVTSITALKSSAATIWDGVSIDFKKLSDRSFYYGDDFFQKTVVSFEDNFLIVQRNDITKKVKVISDDDFCYKFQKRQIKAKDGAAGLFNSLLCNILHIDFQNYAPIFINQFCTKY